jgi:outer membrane lipoprotein-sorting protein
VKHIRPRSASEKPLPAKTASLTELIEQINALAESTKSLQLNVIYQLSGSLTTGEVADYRETEGFILLKNPGFIRLIGLAFKVKVFDMVSDGKDFHIYIPPKNKYIYGLNDQKIKPHKDIPVNLRPQHVFSALMIAPLQPNPQQERLSLEEDEDGKRKYYIVTLTKEMGSGLIALERKIWIDRFDLRLVRQKYYDLEGKVRTDVVFTNFQNYQGKDYPSIIDFRRPLDQYSLRIRVNKASINPNLKDDQFILEQPVGSDLVDLTQETATK